ncbi:hypothetical protein AKG09_03820 [Neisseria sp. 83E34]|nr:hypothetical protein AKG09_03820 [Neisseria sp. 83E34]
MCRIQPFYYVKGLDGYDNKENELWKCLSENQYILIFTIAANAFSMQSEITLCAIKFIGNAVAMI